MGTMRGPAVHDFSASICPRLTKFGTQLPYDNAPRGNSIYFEIPIFYRVFDFWNMLWTCQIFGYQWVLGGDLPFTSSQFLFVLGLPNLVHSFLMTIPPGVIRFISKFLFFIEFSTFEICSGLVKFSDSNGYYEGTCGSRFLRFHLG